VHLPWCERKCPYCDFNSHERRDLPEAAYLRALLRDLEGEVAATPGSGSRPLTSIFIGGGTPSLFSNDGIAQLLSGIRERVELAADCEITMEANPGSTERGRLRGYADAGVTRFSLGIQSFDDRCLQRLGRVHNSDDARRALDAARGSGAASYNLDLMHGLPGQSVARGLADLDAAIAANPEHLSWYQLTIEPNTRFFRAPPALPGEDVLAELEDSGAARLRAAGFHRYEVSAWARPGNECRHNLNYWRFGDYLAIGAGAHGKISDNTGTVLRYRKTRQPEAYLESTGTQRRDPRRLTDEDLRGEFMLGALRLSGGFTVELFEARTGLPFAAVRDTIHALADEGLLESDGAGVRATALGHRFLDDVIGRFFGTQDDRRVKVLASDTPGAA
jgi:oxygen-independent coproporphyrinogen-3 oxidase